MPAWLAPILAFLKDHPEVIADLVAIIKQILALFEKHPNLAEGLAKYLNTPPSA